MISGFSQTGSRQICALETERVKNLVAVETKQKTAGENNIKGEIIQFGWHMQKRGLSEATIQTRIYRLNVLVQKGANLEEPETVETVLAVSEWGKANKKIFANCYKAYCNYKKIDWQLPRITVANKEPFLPLEEEVRQLVAGSGKKTATLLQLLFETGC